MLKFIGLMAIIYLILVGLTLLLGGKKPKRDVYIIQEYEIVEDKKKLEQPEDLPEEQEREPQQDAPPDNVVPINRKK